MNNFYLICPIGLESALISELELKWDIHFGCDAAISYHIEKGGVLIECELKYGLLLNQILKTPSKILLRLKSQKCRDIPKLYNIFKKFPWKDYLNQETASINVTAKKSRLIHTDKIKAAALDGLNDYFSANKIKESIKIKHQNDPKQTLYIRLSNDDLTISLDTSGDLLHIRGDGKFRGHAPIRENFAALLLKILFKDLPKKKYNLIDPMCGSGTFLKEAKNHFSINDRDFNYQYLNKNLLQDRPIVDSVNSHWDVELYGGDIDPEIIKQLDSTSIQYNVQDVFSTEPLNVDKLDNLVIVNPPYGKRVKIKEDKSDYFKKLIIHMEKLYRPKRLGIIIPRPFERALKGQKTYFKQNGIDVCFLVKTV